MHRDSATIPLDAYEQDQFSTSSTYTGPAGMRGTASVGLSPFNVPDAVELSLQTDGSCAFRFDYTNEESPRRPIVTGEHDLSVAIVLGRISGRILEVRALSTRRLFAVGAPPLRLTPREAWYPKLPAHARLVAARHAALIERIVNFAIGELRPQVLDVLNTHP